MASCDLPYTISGAHISYFAEHTALVGLAEILSALQLGLAESASPSWYGIQISVLLIQISFLANIQYNELLRNRHLWPLWGKWSNKRRSWCNLVPLNPINSSHHSLPSPFISWHAWSERLASRIPLRRLINSASDSNPVQTLKVDHSLPSSLAPCLYRILTMTGKVWVS